MERRAFLERSGAAGLALSLPGGLAASRPSAAVTRQSAGYEPLGRVSIDNAAEAVVGDDGETAYVAATTGFVTVDVSDPAEPTVLAEERGVEIDGSPLTNLLDLAVDGDRLVVAGPAQSVSPVGSDDQYLGVRCYDVSDPAAPVPTGAYETGYHVHNCYLEDELLFVPVNTVDRNALVILDIGGDEITQLGYWSLLDHEPRWGDIVWLARYLHDIYVHDDIAYLPFWNAGTYLVDISDPTDPSYVSHVRTTSLADQRQIDDPIEPVYGLPGNDHYAMVDDAGDLLAVGREAWATGGSDPDRPGGIDLYDVSDPARPTRRGSIDPPRTIDESRRGGMWTTSHNFELRDGHLYSSWYRAGVKIHDVSDPTAPERIAWWRDPERTGFWTARVVDPGETFLASSTEAIPNASIDGALYTFPIEAGEQADPPSLQAPEDWGDDDTDATGNGTDTGGDRDSGGNGTGDADDSIPGFTGIAGLVGGGVALERLRRRGNVQD
ncbi:LVIVD repeat-containing protein [Natrinema pallidum]|uniref:LVIVD repeat-containing protein n=1 Tax=Natrinema pallidum TaxID=69527 RepID=A0A4P9TE68_9EURY|nr:hypothetical protein [Natrinema pallidum]QCW03063.1 hypothetical protein FGF80_07365 [Natrinema pallidum]